MMMVSMIIAFENITDPNGDEADEVIEMVTESCVEWAQEVGASCMYVDDAWVAERDEMDGIKNLPMAIDKKSDLTMLGKEDK